MSEVIGVDGAADVTRETPELPVPAWARRRKRSTPHLQTLEALRLGVVPFEEPERMTVGRDSELALVDDDLAQASEQGAARVFLGDYGTGKTHLLELIEHKALKANFLCARVTLDEEEVAPSHPQRVYRALCRGLRYPDGDVHGSLAPLFERLRELPLKGWLQPGHADYHAYLSPALAYHRALEPDEELSDELLGWLQGQPSEPNMQLEARLRNRTRVRGHRLYALKDYRPWAHLYSYLTGGLAVLARQAGYAGLCLLFDEAEFYALLSTRGREFADLVFGYYVTAALGADRSHFALDSAKRGGHARHRSFPPLFKERQPLYCAFALTEDPRGVAGLRNIVGDDRLHRLTPLALSHYQEMCLKVVELYREAYPKCKVGAEVQNPMGQVVYRGVERGVLGNPRQVLKFVMELLDFSRLRRSEIPDFIAEVLELLRR